MTTELTADQARSLEQAFLSGLNDAQDAYERIVSAAAWRQLGFATFAAWWTERVQPVMGALSMRPTREIASAVVEQVRTEEASLPPAQRRSQRELAEMAGVGQRTVSRWSRSTYESSDSDVDLDRPQVPTPKASPLEPRLAREPIISPTSVGHYRNPPQDADAEDRRQRLIATHQLCEVVVTVAQMRGFDTGWKYDPAMALPGRAVTTEVLTDARQAIDELLKIWDERGMQ